MRTYRLNSNGTTSLMKEGDNQLSGLLDVLSGEESIKTDVGLSIDTTSVIALGAVVVIVVIAIIYLSRNI